MSNKTDDLSVPADWFYMDSESFRRDYNSSTWPWSRLTIDQLTSLTATFEQYTEYYTKNVSQKVLYTFSALGILGGCLIVATILKMPHNLRTNFYRIMNIIAVLDLAFLIDSVIRNQLTTLDDTSTAANVAMFITSGTVYCLSLISDLLTLALSVERFVALTFPAKYKQLEKTGERRLWNYVIVAATVLSLCRARYAFGNAFYTIRSVTDTTFFLCLTYFSDSIVPVAMAVIMILMMAGILRVLIRRIKFQTAATDHMPHTTVGDQLHHKHISDSMKTMSLLAALMAMFLLNQSTYIYYEIAYVTKDRVKLSFDSDLAEAKEFLRLLLDLELASNVSTLTEVASKTFTFYTYIIFSATFRNYFLHMIRPASEVEDIAVPIRMSNQTSRTSAHSKTNRSLVQKVVEMWSSNSHNNRRLNAIESV